MKKIIVIVLLAALSVPAFSQTDSTRTLNKKEKKAEERRRRETLARQSEEGVLAFSKHLAGGVQLRTNGYGAFVELGRARSPRFTNLFVFELTEIKHNKEEKSSGDGFFSNAFVYGKINNF